jgi:hypothetical protein
VDWVAIWTALVASTSFLKNFLVPANLLRLFRLSGITFVFRGSSINFFRSSNILSKFRFFVGLIAKPSNQPRQKTAVDPTEAEVDDLSDEDGDEYAGTQRQDDTGGPATASLIVAGAVLPPADLDDAQETRMNSFLDYPEQSIKVFLSLYTYDKGFHL